MKTVTEPDRLRNVKHDVSQAMTKSASEASATGWNQHPGRRKEHLECVEISLRILSEIDRKLEGKE